MISFLTHWEFKRILFRFHIFVNFSVFFLLLISSFIPLWIEEILGISILNVLKLTMWFILENVPCPFEKTVFFCCWMQCSVYSFIGLLKSSVFLLICLVIFGFSLKENSKKLLAVHWPILTGSPWSWLATKKLESSSILVVYMHTWKSRLYYYDKIGQLIFRDIYQTV